MFILLLSLFGIVKTTRKVFLYRPDMKSLAITLTSDGQPKYLQIASAIRQAINQGQLRPGEQLPSVRVLATELGCNRHTIMSALQELIAQGWLFSEQRKGYLVSKLLPISSSKGVAHSCDSDKRFDWKTNETKLTSIRNKPAHQYCYNFAGGMPDIDEFPFKQFKSFVSEAVAKAEANQLNYGSVQGSEQFLNQVGTYLRRVRALTNKELVAVNGSQEALYIVAHLLLNPGSKVVVETLGYKPAWQAFESAGGELIGIERTKNGFDLALVEKLFNQEDVKLIYLTPLHQYPTTYTIPVHQRIALYQLAAKYNVAIVEDDYDHEFHYDSQPLAPMAANDPYGLVIYLATFSKIMFPGVRTGVMAVDKALLPAVLSYRTIMNHKPNSFMQDAIALWIKEGGFERHVRKMAKRYSDRRNVLIELIENYKKQGLSLSYHLPAGGMALWLDIKNGADKVEQFCQQHNIYLQSERNFHLNSAKNQNRYIRIGFAGMSAKKLTQGLTIIFDYIKQLQDKNL